MDTTAAVTGTEAITVLIPVTIPVIITGEAITEVPVIIMAVAIITAAILVVEQPILQVLPHLDTPASPAVAIKRIVEEAEDVLAVASVAVAQSTKTNPANKARKLDLL
jgi:hypothetical protein